MKRLKRKKSRNFLLTAAKSIAIFVFSCNNIDKACFVHIKTGVDPRSTKGVGSTVNLINYEENLGKRFELFEKLLKSGVNIPLFDGILIDPGVVIEPGATILPGCILRGGTVVGAGCEIGPNSVLTNAVIGEGSVINASYITDSSVGKDCRIGPFTQLRPGSKLGDGVKIGDFVELKNAVIGDKTSVAHLTYLGDCEVGQLCNFGCGVVTANYDGKKKYTTTVGDRAFIGCNTNLISPVHVGDGAYTAAGTTVDRDVPDGALAVGRVRQKNLEGWADANVAFKKDGKA